MQKKRGNGRGGNGKAPRSPQRPVKRLSDQVETTVELFQDVLRKVSRKVAPKHTHKPARRIHHI